MNVTSLFKKCFSPKNLEELYCQKVRYSKSVGLDKVGPSTFEKNLSSEISIIVQKVNNGTYHFTRYKQLLLLKGPKKYPREISIPTIRDKLTLTALNEFLTIKFDDHLYRTPLPQIVIQSIISEKSSNQYNYYLKFDIKEFYSSIDHKILFRKIRRTLRKREAISLIAKAISTTSTSFSKNSPNVRCKGVPEGVPISNILANIYLHDIDLFWKSREDVSYHRYVDDILILCKQEAADEICGRIAQQIKQLHLCLHTDKTERNPIAHEFTYLGYLFKEDIISVRQSSVYNLESNLEKMLSLAHPNLDGLLSPLIRWKLNLRITGFIAGEKKYGWLFFFSQMNDMELLSHLDWLIQELFIRNKIKNDFQIKRFHRTYYELRYKLSHTTYIPNFNHYTLQEKEDLLEQLQIPFEKGDSEGAFHRLIVKTAAELERDVQSFS